MVATRAADKSEACPASATTRFLFQGKTNKRDNIIFNQVFFCGNKAGAEGARRKKNAFLTDNKNNEGKKHTSGRLKKTRGGPGLSGPGRAAPWNVRTGRGGPKLALGPLCEAVARGCDRVYIGKGGPTLTNKLSCV